MQTKILFQSLERIQGKEGRSKLLHQESSLYSILHRLKKVVSEKYTVGDDRMDLHIEITKDRRDPQFALKAQSINGKSLDLADPDNWGFLGRAFVLWTPTVEAYGKTHITLSFFGSHPRPDLEVLRNLVLAELEA